MADNVIYSGRGQEYSLLDFCQRISSNPYNIFAIHFYFSLLKIQNRRETHMRAAVNLLEELIFPFSGKLFILGNQDIVVITSETTLEDVDEIIQKLRTLLSRDPLSEKEVVLALTDRRHIDHFASIYDLGQHLPQFTELCNQNITNELNRQQRLKKMVGDNFRQQTESAVTPVTLEQLGKIEEMLRRGDLSSFFRRQTVYQIQSNSEPKPLFIELYVATTELFKTMAPKADIAADGTMFQLLTRMMDKRMLGMIGRGEDRALRNSFSLNINVRSIFEKEFILFDDFLGEQGRKTVILEIKIHDIYADYNNYCFARDFVQEKGYRICVDGITPVILPLIDRKYMKADLVKIFADAQFADEMPQQQFSELDYAIKKISPSRIILAHCENDAQIRAGQRLEIGLFQGFFLDQYMRNLNNAINMAKPTPPIADRKFAKIVNDNGKGDSKIPNRSPVLKEEF